MRTQRVSVPALVASALVCAAPAHGQAPQQPPPQISIADAGRVVEQGPGQRPLAKFKVTLSRAHSQEVRFGYGDCCGTADSGFDHDTIAGNVGIPPGQTSYTIEVGISGDSRVEPDETFSVYLDNVQNATVARGQAGATIVDDDGRPAGTTIDVADAAPAGEGTPDGAGGRARFTVTLSANATAPMSIDYATADDTATAGSDYQSASGRLTFAPGERSKTVEVALAADAAHEPDETLKLVLSNPSGAGPGRGTGVATIVNDDAAPPLPPAEPQEHTLLGVVTYVSPFGPGFQRVDLLGPFAAPVRDLMGVAVRLQRPDGSVVAEQRLEIDAFGDPYGPVPYRFDRLGACRDCAVVLLGDRAVRDQQPVSFGGEPGETDVDLEWDRASRGGVVEGTVLTPLGARPSDLRVAIVDPAGRVLADDRQAPRCDRSSASAGCDSGPRASYRYRLVGLPLAPVPVRVVLRQFSGGGVGKLVDVDSTEFTLDPSGRTEAPDVTSVGDVPTNAGVGRTLYGQINFRRPFAPGQREKADLDLPERELRGLTVELRTSGGQVRKRLREFDRTPLGYTGFTMRNLDACEGCKVVLREDQRTVDEAAVTIPDRSPTLTRRDLNFADAGEPEFLLGAIAQGPASTDNLHVDVRDAVTGAVLTASPRRPRKCGSEPGDRCTLNRPLYRLGKVPPDRDVVLTLSVGSRAVDQQLLRTAPAGEVTQAPLLVVPFGRGPRSLHGHVRSAGPFAPGGEPVSVERSGRLEARLLDSEQRELARAPVHRGRGGLEEHMFVFSDVPPCEACTLELLAGPAVSDRVAIEQRPVGLSVTVQDLRWGALSGGAYVNGEVVIRRQDPRADDRIHVQVLAADGRVLADSTRLPKVDSEGLRARRRYRLGGIPRDAGAVKVVALSTKGRRLAARDVTIVPGAGDTDVPDLRVG